MRLGGLKFSDECTSVHLEGASARLAAWTELLGCLSREKINLSYACATGTGGLPQASFCLTVEDLIHWRLLAATLASGPQETQDVIENAATLLLFPHQSRLGVLGCLLAVLGKHQLPIYSLCTSLSGIATVTDHRQLDRIAEVLLQHVSLPANHAPFRPEPPAIDSGGRVPGGSRLPVETSASFWEPQIRIYGVNRVPDCSMTTLEFSTSDMTEIGQGLQRADEHGRLDLAVMQRTGDSFRLTVVDRRGSDLDGLLPAAVLLNRCPVDLLSMFGPHFQDRYGVLYTALHALCRHAIPVVAVSCSGSSIFLAVAHKSGEAAVAALTELFIVPKV